MKTVQFTNIYLEHFGKHENIKSELGHRVLIEGANATGKSTVKRAIQYILGSRDENGKEITGIRPHDENGVDIDGLTTVAEMTVSVDGAENTLKRTCFQEKNRQGEYTGKDNLQYFVDDVKKGTKKSYEEFVQTIVPNMVCICANELLSKDTAGRRAMLEPFSKHTADDIIAENPEFEPLRGKLKANDVRELKSALRKKIDGEGKGANHIDGLADERQKIIHKIEFELSRKQDIDIAELELHRNALNEQIAENKAKQEDISKEFEEQQKASDGILELKFKLNDLQRKANEDLEKQRREIRGNIDKVARYAESIKREIQRNREDIERGENAVSRNTILINATRNKWEAANEREFDDSNLVCSYCGQLFQEEKQEGIKAKFAENKAEELVYLTKEGNELKSAIDKGKAEIEQLKTTLAENEKALSKMDDEIKGYEEQLDKLPQSIDISGRPEVQEIQRQIAEKEQAMNKGNSAKEIRQKLREEYEELQKQLNKVQKQFDKVEGNNCIDERIEKLKQEQRDLSQEIADIEKELDLLKQFERKKAELLESDINSNFNIIEWHMFKKMQNGDLADICSPFVNGTNYDGNLNKGARILTQLDICLSFQKLHDVQIPILLDDGESIDSWRIPQVANQLIIFKRTDDKELKIECLED